MVFVSNVCESLECTGKKFVHAMWRYGSIAGIYEQIAGSRLAITTGESSFIIKCIGAPHLASGRTEWPLLAEMWLHAPTLMRPLIKPNFECDSRDKQLCQSILIRFYWCFVRLLLLYSRIPFPSELFKQVKIILCTRQWPVIFSTFECASIKIRSAARIRLGQLKLWSF